MKQIKEIDFVILWVDGSDGDWQKEFAKAKHEQNEDSSNIRFRDWNNLQYWFRGVEKFAPWVRKIHFITCGHLPAWLDTSHPKLNIVSHADYIPSKYLPTFNSNTIELNIGRIKGVAEQFVLFNDDTFLCRECTKEDFFVDGLPRDIARLSVVLPSSVGHIIYNNMELINGRYNKNKVVKNNFGKWFSPKYGVMNLLKSLTLMPWHFFSGITDHHMPQPYLKMQVNRVWEVWGAELDKSCLNQFRNLADLSHWLIRYDSICRGEFVPRSFSDSSLMTISESSIEGVCETIKSQDYRMICINDSVEIEDFETLSTTLCEAFEAILPKKSSYEI